MSLFVTSHLRLAVVILWIGVILLGSTTKAETFCEHILSGIEELLYGDDDSPDDGLEPDRFWQKKTIHVTLFAVLSVVVFRAVTGTRFAMWTAMVFVAVVVGAASEAVQFLYPTRVPALRDVLINAASGTVTASMLIRKRSANANGAAIVDEFLIR